MGHDACERKRGCQRAMKLANTLLWELPELRASREGGWSVNLSNGLNCAFAAVITSGVSYRCEVVGREWL